MRRIYRVEYELKYEGLDEWFTEAKSVFSTKGAEGAIEKAKKAADEVWVDEGDEGDDPVERPLTGFRLVSVTVLAEAEL